MLRPYTAAVSVEDVEASMLRRHDTPDDTLTADRAIILTAYLDQLSVEQAWTVRAYLQSPDCLSDEQFVALVLEEIRSAVRTCLADHIIQCQCWTDAYQLL